MVHTYPDRWIRFIAAEDGETYYGLPTLPLTSDIGLLYASRTTLTALVLSSSPLLPTSSPTSRTLTVSKLLSPLEPSSIPQIKLTGGQYPGQHKNIKPSFPFVFTKSQKAVVGPGEELRIPKLASGKNNLWEVELAVVIGKEARDVGVEEALDYVAGYTVVNDVTAGGLFSEGLSWAKGFDTYLPLGPVVVSTNVLKDPHSLKLNCKVNGNLVQEGLTADMLSTVSDLVSKFSQGTTLEVGSVICTGSPTPFKNEAGVIERYLEHGDEVVCWIEGIGSLITPVVDETVEEENSTVSKKKSLI